MCTSLAAVSEETVPSPAIRCIILHSICMIDDTDNEVTASLEMSLNFYAYGMATDDPTRTERVQPPKISI